MIPRTLFQQFTSPHFPYTRKSVQLLANGFPGPVFLSLPASNPPTTGGYTFSVGLAHQLRGCLVRRRAGHGTMTKTSAAASTTSPAATSRHRGLDRRAASECCSGSRADRAALQRPDRRG